MPEIVLVCEDTGHWQFVKPMIDRVISEECAQEPTVRVDSRSGGRPSVIRELRGLCARTALRPGDVLVVCLDADDRETHERRNEVLDVSAPLITRGIRVVPVVPDPEIEKWMLVDDRAFAQLFGRGCRLHQGGATGDDFKGVLEEELENLEIDAPLGGMEYAADVVRRMDFQLASNREPSFRAAYDSLRQSIRELCEELA